MTKKVVIITLIISVLILCLIGSCSLNSPSQIIIDNETDLSIIELYIVASESTAWNNNLLTEPISPGGQKTFSDFSAGEYKAKVVFENSFSIEIDGIVLGNKEIKTIVVKP
mgnify:FL=1